MREKLVIWGAGSTAMIVADIVRLRDQYEIVGFLDNVNLDRAQTEFCGATNSATKLTCMVRFGSNGFRLTYEKSKNLIAGHFVSVIRSTAE